MMVVDDDDDDDDDDENIQQMQYINDKFSNEKRRVSNSLSSVIRIYERDR